MEPFYPLHAWCASAASSSSSRSSSRREAIFRDYAYFSSYSTSWVEHCPALHGDDGRALRPRPGQPGGRDREQRRLSAPVLRGSTACRCSASSRRRTSPRSPSRKGIPTLVELLRRRDGARACAPERQRRSADRQQRARPRARHQRLRRRHAAPAQPRRRDHDGVPAPAAADRREPVRHDLPRALLVSVLRRGASGSSPRHGLRLFDVEELPTHGGSLRIYGCHADDAGKPETDRAVELLRARGRRRYSSARDLPRLRRQQVAKRQAQILATFDRAQASASRAIVGYGPPARATRCSTTAGSAPTSSTTPSTAARTSRATTCRARTSRSARPRRFARHDRTTCSSCRGT